MAREQAVEAAWQPRKLGRYWLLDTIASGRVGVVYEALLRLAGKPDRLLAIKRVSTELSRDHLFSARLLDVMARAAELKHPVCCAIANYGRADGSLCVVMEWVPGKDLAQIAGELRERGEAMPPRLVAYVGSQIADALAAAHLMTRAGQPAPLCHGDLALANILIGYDGRVRLTGLGSAELQASAPGVACHGYRAPELAQGFACDARSDVFALGACLYELLVGEPPLIARPGGKRSGKPESSIRRLIPRPLDQIVGRALMEQPDARWQSAAEMAQALERLTKDDGEPAGPKALGVFMRTLFEAVIKGEQLRLDALLARVATASASETGVHRLGSDAMQSSPPASQPPQPSSAAPQTGVVARPPQPPSVRPPPPKRRAQEARVDLAELTPPRGYLMEQLAAEMHDATREALAAPVSQAPISSAPRSTDSALAPSALAPSARSLPMPQRPTRSSSKLPLVIALAGLLALGAFALWRSQAGTGEIVAASLVVRTHPAGAEVFVRGERLGTTPLPSTAMDSGSVVVELRAPGFDTERRTVELQPGKVIELDLDLHKRDAPRVDAQPPIAVAPTSEELDGADDVAASHDKRERRRRTVGSRVAPVNDRAEVTTGEEQAAVEDVASNVPPAEMLPVEAQPASPQVSISQAAPQPVAAIPASGTASAATPQAVAPAPALTGTPAAPRAAAPEASRPAASQAVASRGVTRDAVLLERAQPKFPPRAKRLDVYEGTVTIEFTVDRTGNVRTPKVVQAVPAKVFEETALIAIQKFKYRPKTVDNVPVESRNRFTFRFEEEN